MVRSAQIRPRANRWAAASKYVEHLAMRPNAARRTGSSAGEGSMIDHSGWELRSGVASCSLPLTELEIHTTPKTKMALYQFVT